MNTKLTSQIHCPPAPATRCVTLEEASPQVFRSFDPVRGDPRELFQLKFWGGGWGVLPTGEIALLREDASGGRIQVLSPAGAVQREIRLSPWMNLVGLDLSFDGSAMYSSSAESSGVTVLRVNQSGQIQPLWLLKGTPWTWSIPSPDDQHLAVLELSSYSNAWKIEGF